jgi:trans-2,3-dihydro-3-hydroxyanthranilate isomerase
MSSEKGLPYDVVDVFAEAPFAGNPLAVVFDAARLDARAMQRIAREMNLSETTFVLHAAAHDAAFDVRIFTPQHELPYAGHPTLGTAFAIRARWLGARAHDLTLRLGVGVVPVRFDDDGLVWLTTPSATFAPGPDRAAVAAALGLPVDALDARLPIEVATTGEPQVLVPLRDLAALGSCAIAHDAYRALRASGAPASLYVFARETRDARNQLSARMFAPDLGVIEDPATGSAAGWLAAYLRRHRVLAPDDFIARVEQGHEMQRPSLLHIRVRGADPEIAVGGRVIPIARGELCAAASQGEEA